ncbi:MAG: pyruvate dehydrogenase [Anaerolineales bacterium]|uniref:Pyruvate dehydrogenase n=1 Tax=Candidatus Desulfolinea nitratireducens TaxID=2841698 RepID=A0A8J6NM95_9CHLR|nr:pyruvate dehydrogenase [Candidatus Desulfolinea nitratireducens]MBL6960121.1 pyruvate dehydrogenase [Anaerolineales bacterium]
MDWPKIARLLLTSRIMDELEENELVPQGKIMYQFSAKGHELAQILLAQTLTHPHDAATVYYRSRPFMLAAGLSVQEAFAAGYAKTGSPSEGRDVGVVFSMKARDSATVLPSSGAVGAQYTPAAGWAQAIRYRQKTGKDNNWDHAIALALGGEGSTAANGFWAALNIVTTRDLPYLFFIEDNGFAISVRSESQTPGGNLAANLRSYKNLHIIEADGTDPVDASVKIAQAVAYVRDGKPCLIRLKVVRIMGHTFIDDQSYKSDVEREEDIERDPLNRLKDFLPDLDWDALEKEVEAEVRAAADIAFQHPDPEPASATDQLFSSPSLTEKESLSGTAISPDQDGSRISLIEAVKRTLESEMLINPDILVFGEDVGLKGGVHGATAHMQEKFGEERVFDTSLSEEGIMGSAVGLSAAGLMPVPEIQFRKYADPATEQINDIGTLRWRTAGKFSAPMVLRIPVGFGRKTGDPWHSVTGEAIYAHTLGWQLAYPSNAADAAGLLRTALRGEDPVIFFEHRALLDTSQARRPWPGDAYTLPLGVANKLSEGEALTVVTWGAMVYPVLEASKGLEGVEILDLRTISPWDKVSVLSSVKKTGRCLIVHEDTLTGGFAGEIMAVIASEAFEWLDAPPQRLTTPDTPIPYNLPMMNAVLPGMEKIRKKMNWLLAY